MTNQKIQVMVVEPNALLREGLRSCLASLINIEISGVAGDLTHAASQLSGTQTRVLIVSSSLLAESGGSLPTMENASGDSPQVLILADSEDPAAAEQAFEAGAQGFLSRDTDPETLADAIRRVGLGELVAGPKLMSSILRRLRKGSSASHDPVAQLSERELQIFRLTGEGLEAKEIADRLDLSPRTVDVHRANIRNKLGIRGAHELMRYAMNWEHNGRISEQLRSFCRESRPLLLVEDDDVDVMCIRRALAELRSETPLAISRTGEEGLTYLRDSKNPRPFLILLDINMPRMNGHEFLEELRQDPSLGSLPVVVLSSSEHEEDKGKMYRRGITGYLVKPQSAAEYMDMFRTLAQYWAIIAKPGTGRLKGRTEPTA
jgi:DNA-binding NarL/FixJ family response regulator